MNEQTFCFNEATVSVLKNLVGKKLHRYRCDPFNFSTTVYENVSFYIQDELFQLTNDFKTVDYFGDREDVAVMRFAACLPSDVHSCIGNSESNGVIEQIDHYVEDTIMQINIVNEIQRVFTDGIQTDELRITRGLIFYFKSREISFEKSWDLSEFIIINQGENLVDKFQSTNDFADKWHSPDFGTCTREIIILK